MTDATERERARKAEFRRKQRKKMKEKGLTEVLVVVHETRRDDIRSAALGMMEPK